MHLCSTSSFSGSIYSNDTLVAAVSGMLAQRGGLAIGGSMSLPDGLALEGMDYTLVLDGRESLRIVVSRTDDGGIVFVTDEVLQHAARVELERATD